MSKTNIRYSEESLADLTNIFDYIASDSSTRASSYIDKLENAISQLEEYPNIGVSCKKKLVRHDCRVLIVDSFLVFYKHFETIREVIIYRIFRDKQDYLSLY